MIRELVEFGKKIRTTHDAIKLEPIDIDLIIDENGNFIQFSVIERILKPAEAIAAKKGKARLLLDKAEEVLGYINNEKNKLIKDKGKSETEAEIEAQKAVNFKHNLFLEKINEYKDLLALKPVLKFYYDNKENGINKALKEFENQVKEKERAGNIAFRVNGKDVRIHELKEVIDAIIDHYEKTQLEKLSKEKKKCSVCGKSDFPILEGPHGMIKKVPNGQTSGCALVSYNEDAYESYNLPRNLNSSICTNCARNYVEGLNYLMTNGYEVKITKNKKIEKTFKYTNRKNLGNDTAVVYWTKEDVELEELDWLDKPDPGQVANLIESVVNAKNKVSEIFDSYRFYSITLSGVASRIAVRDWIEVSIEEYRQNIARWFNDLAIKYYDRDSKELKKFYPSFNELLLACKREDTEEDDVTAARVAKYLWNCALKNQKPPLWILTIVLKRIAHYRISKDGKSKNSFTKSRASLIKFILNRNNQGGEIMAEELDFENKSPAYLCGRLFALIEGIQRAALGEINAGIRERFFAAASSCPAPTFGRLMRLSQNHLTKLKQEKPGLAVILDKEITDLCSQINQFPTILSLEQQGQFALGYYHQKQFNFNRSKQNKEFESLTEKVEEHENE